MGILEFLGTFLVGLVGVLGSYGLVFGLIWVLQEYVEPFFSNLFQKLPRKVRKWTKIVFAVSVLTYFFYFFGLIFLGKL